MIFPMCSLDSISEWASAACSSGKDLKISGLIVFASRSGHTFALSEWAMFALNETDRGLNVDPVIVNLLRRTSVILKFVLTPPKKAIITNRPSSDRHFKLRCK